MRRASSKSRCDAHATGSRRASRRPSRSPKENSRMLMQGRAALVTGGAGRLGRVIATTLRREGAKVVIADRNAPAIDQAAAELDLAGVPGDVTRKEDVERMVAEAERL